MADKDQKQQIENLKKIAKSAQGAERDQARAKTLAEVNSKILSANNDIAELNRLDRTDEANQLQQEIADLAKSLKNNESFSAVINRLDEANQLVARSNEAATRALSKEEEQAARDKDIANRLKPLSDLSASLRSQTNETETLTNTMKSIENLQGLFGRLNNETSKNLARQFEEAQANLEEAIINGNTDAEKFAREQIAAIGDAAESEEKRREAQKALDEQNDALLKTANGVEGLGNKFDDFASNAAGGIGFLATLGTLALLFLDPEKFAELIGQVITNITNIFSGIYRVFTGDIEGGLGLISENLGTFAALLGGLVLFLGGPLLKGISAVLKVARVVRGFVLLQWAPAMAAALSGMATSFMAMVAPFAPIIAIAAGVIAIIGGLYYGFQKLRESLGPGAGIIDTLKVAALYLVDFLSMLVNGITFVPRKIIGFLGARAAKWLFGEDFDTSALDAISQGLRTDRGATAAEEMRLANEARAAEEAAAKPEMPTFDQALEGDGTFDAALNTSGFNLDDLNSENFDLALEGQSGGGSNINLMQQNPVNSRQTTNTTIIEQPTSPGMGILSGLSFAR